MQARRVVTVNGEDGRSRVMIDEPTAAHFDFGPLVISEVWKEPGPKPDLARPDQLDSAGSALVPPKGGSVCRLVTFAPHGYERITPEVQADMARRFDRTGGEYDPDRAGFHTTNTIDYGIVVVGEIDMMLDDGAVHLRAGDCVVQRGTGHAWHNNGDVPCTMAFILISAETA